MENGHGASSDGRFASGVAAALAEVEGLVPGVIRAAVILLPDGVQLAAFGEPHEIDYEPLVRACTRCFGPGAGSLALAGDQPRRFDEFYALLDDGLVVMQRGRRKSRVALASVCALEVNLALVLTWTRRAIELVEASIDFADLDVDC